MTKHLSTQDFEILSAYLDGELTPQEQSRLEHSLGQRSDLQQALDELRRTRIILHSASRVHSPRNFTLTAEMVGGLKPAGKSFFAFNALRFSSALASILLVLSVIGEWFAFSGPLAAPVAMMSEPTSEAISLAPQTALLPAVTSESTGMRQIPTEEPSAKALSAPEETTTPVGEVSALASPATESPPEESTTLNEPMLGSAMVAETPTLEAPPLEASPVLTETPMIEAFSADETPAPELPELLAQSAPTQETAADAGEALAMQPAEAESAAPEENSHLPWRLAQVILLVLALLSASGAFIVYQINRTRTR